MARRRRKIQYAYLYLHHREQFVWDKIKKYFTKHNIKGEYLDPGGLAAYVRFPKSDVPKLTTYVTQKTGISYKGVPITATTHVILWPLADMSEHYLKVTVEKFGWSRLPEYSAIQGRRRKKRR